MLYDLPRMLQAHLFGQILYFWNQLELRKYKSGLASVKNMFWNFRGFPSPTRQGIKRSNFKTNMFFTEANPFLYCLGYSTIFTAADFMETCLYILTLTAQKKLFWLEMFFRRKNIKMFKHHFNTLFNYPKTCFIHVSSRKGSQ